MDPQRADQGRAGCQQVPSYEERDERFSCQESSVQVGLLAKSGRLPLILCQLGGPPGGITGYRFRSGRTPADPGGTAPTRIPTLPAWYNPCVFAVPALALVKRFSRFVWQGPQRQFAQAGGLTRLSSPSSKTQGSLKSGISNSDWKRSTCFIKRGSETGQQRRGSRIVRPGSRAPPTVQPELEFSF